MTTTTPSAIYLKDYVAPYYLVKKTQLTFELYDEFTIVSSKLTVERVGGIAQPMELYGVDLDLQSITLGGLSLTENDYRINDESLIIATVPSAFELVVVTKIYPHKNSSLEGLYQSKTMYCTQCEAEGFRKITYYPDRPDVLSIFSVRIEACVKRFPVLLSNGNCVDKGDVSEGRHYACWNDPYPKPSYLFALVAGDLNVVSDQFVTRSGRNVDIEVYVEAKDVDKCGHAITSLKNAMRWDEQVYGREYDLDVYMIVAVDDFNMGAMENKGLNIFNTSCVLARADTTTDDAFQRVEAVIAHEYFHNWSGNRVTCRDWFQLSLKEGFTVFRDEAFSADMNSKTVKRVEDVQLLRSLQFAEDAGPMAHPVRPAAYIEISNFYTLTVYEKGAEVVRMIRTLIGTQAFRRGSDLYFERHDGSAATIEDFVQAMADASGYDFSQFMLWYSQAGTPNLDVTFKQDLANCTLEIGFAQSCPDTPEASSDQKSAFVIPVSLGLVGEQGAVSFAVTQSQQKVEETVVAMDQTAQKVTLHGVEQAVVPVVLKGFSAPVNLSIQYSDEQLLQIMRVEPDGFSRWNAAEQLALNTVTQVMTGDQVALDSPLIQGVKTLLADAELDPAMVALMLNLPSESYIGQQFDVVDVESIHNARKKVANAIAMHCNDELLHRFEQCKDSLGDGRNVKAQTVALRSLKNTALRYLLNANDQSVVLAEQQFANGFMMSDVLGALKAMLHSSLPRAQTSGVECLELFYSKWKGESLVVNQWLAVQAGSPIFGTLNRIESLLSHEAFDANNPNKIRSLVGVFCNQNLINFHQSDGKGYQFLTAEITRLNTTNPQIAARLLTPLTKWRRYDKHRQAAMKAQLELLKNTKGLAKDVYEVVVKSLTA